MRVEQRYITWGTEVPRASIRPSVLVVGMVQVWQSTCSICQLKAIILGMASAAACVNSFFDALDLHSLFPDFHSFAFSVLYRMGLLPCSKVYSPSCKWCTASDVIVVILTLRAAKKRDIPTSSPSWNKWLRYSCMPWQWPASCAHHHVLPHSLYLHSWEPVVSRTQDEISSLKY